MFNSAERASVPAARTSKRGDLVQIFSPARNCFTGARDASDRLGCSYDRLMQRTSVRKAFADGGPDADRKLTDT